MRARSELTELRLPDLCFTQEEARQFCNQVMKLGLKDDQIAALAERVKKDFPKLDVLMNNAGVGGTKNLTDPAGDLDGLVEIALSFALCPLS